MYHVLYDGTISDHRRFVVIGGSTETAMSFLRESYRENLTLPEAVQLCRKALGKTNDERALDENSLEIAVLDRKREGRKFQRVRKEDVVRILGATGSA
jgi:proteasome alpha subunit